jgi:hypothetical protein
VVQFYGVLGGSVFLNAGQDGRAMCLLGGWFLDFAVLLPNPAPNMAIPALEP